MNPKRIEELLSRVAAGELAVADALNRLRDLPFEDLGFARVDHHRELRQGAPEVVFAAGKQPHQVAEIGQAIVERGSNLLVTRADQETFAAVQTALTAAEYHPRARAITLIQTPGEPCGRVAILCAGTSDLPVAEEAAVSARFFGAEVEEYADVGVAGLHRLGEVRAQLDQADALIVVAGMEGALPSVVGGLVRAPVIAVPTSVGYGASFGGIAALLGMLNSCAAGLTVVNIDNGFGAAAAAHRILAHRKR